MLHVSAKPKAIRVFTFHSKSSDNIWETRVWNDGKITCDCPAYKKCWHVKQVEKYLQKEKLKEIL